LRASEARLRAVTHALPDRVFVVDEEGLYCDVLADPRNQSVTGAVSLKGKLLSEVHAPDKAALFLGLIHGALATQQIHVAEYELPTHSGRRWFESRTVPLDVRFNDKPATIVIVRDLTERKLAESQLRQAQKMQAIGQLTGGIAHDFNNLLAVIMGNLELLHEQLTAQPRLLELTQQALKSVDRGANLSRRLLAFARRQPLLAQPTNLNRLVLGMLDLIQRTLGSTIRVDKALATDLGMTLVDPEQLESALLNLVINARDAMPHGGRLLVETTNALLDEAQVAAYQEDVRPGPYVMLAVWDSGSGMAPEVLEHAFEPFFSTKDAGRGSGLGLSMVYGLVKQSGGHITIDSEPGQGSTVRLYLPRIEYQETSALSEPSASDHAYLQGQGETILVVEDDTGVRSFVVTALERMGYDIRQADTAAIALQILDATPEIALLFTDIMLPGDMDGVQLAAEAQRRWPGLRVLFTSGYTEHALVGNGRITEGVEVLTKPYHKSELARKLCLLLRPGKPPISG
ncbi:MAG TPA: ATP-binding protein, partial [Candidatus Competibacteraceae bacterium]|nr:ATP-binding protein [Candidatus Competibacteraceae bacterium]